MSERTPEERELIERIWWLIQFRWVALAGVLGTIWLARQGLGVYFPTGPVYGVAAGLGVINLFFTWDAARVLKGNSGEDLRVRFARVFANVQIALDLVVLTLLLHFAGGITNPFRAFYIFHVIVASILLSRKAAYLQTALAIVLFEEMALAEYFGWIPHVPLEGYADPDAYRQFSHLAGDSFVLISTLTIAVCIATSLTAKLREKRARIVRLMLQIEEKARELQEANEKLLVLDKLKTEFMLRVTHELRSPLAAIQSNLGVVINGYLGSLEPQQKELLARADLRAKGLLHLINELLSLSRMRSGNYIRRREILCLEKIIEEVIHLLRPQAEAKSLTLDVMMPDVPLPVEADRESMIEVFTNLVSNAIKYTPSGGKITVDAAREGQHIRVRVADTGIGIGPEDLPHVFEEFYRTQHARETDREGTGLGLPIVKQLVEMHGGSVSVESQEQKGSCFQVILPAVEAGVRSEKSALAISG